MNVRTSLVCTCALAFFTSSALAADFLDKRTSVAVGEIKADLELTLRQALARTVGANSPKQNGFLGEIESQLAASFKALPKNNLGLLDQAALHHLVRNRFIKENGWYLKGLEPQNTNISADTNETAGILNEKIPLYIEQLLGARSTSGFALHHAVAMVATLEHVIIHEGVTLLDAAYRIRGFVPEDKLDAEQIGNVLDSYMVLFLLGSNPADKNRHMQELAHITKIFPAWGAAQTFFRDVFQDTLFSIKARSNPFTNDGHLFDHAWKALDVAARKYGKFQDGECRDMKTALTALDPEITGRVPIKDFYKKLLDGSFPFSESPGYLRSLGALDESAPGRGPQVIIPNYLNSLNNCIMSGTHYSICCVNECIGLLNNIEARIGAPSATPAELLSIVEHMSSSTIHAPRNLSTGLSQALDQVAAHHSGKVPLHGRLFAQWMHYAFPHECAYPHISTSGVQALTPVQFKNKTGTGGFVTVEDFKQLSKIDFSGPSAHMSQWTMDEELHIGIPQNNEPGVYSTFFRRCMQGVLIMAVALTLLGKIDRILSLSRAAPKAQEYFV